MKGNFLANFFPPPAYLSLPAVGLDVSDHSVKYVELKKKKGEISIHRFGGHLIPQGLIGNGEVKDKEKLVAFLRSLQKELKSKHVIAALPEEKAFLARIKMPLMKEEEIRDALELQLEEHIPLTPGEAIFDFNVIKETSGESHLDVYLIAFPKKIVEDYCEVFKEAGFILLALEMEMQALARTIIPREEKKTVVLVDFGRTRTSFAIVRGSQVQFTTTIGVAGEDLEKALMKNLNVDQVQAEKIKKEAGFVKSKENEKVFDAILPIISVIKDEVGKCVEYWNSSFEAGDPRKVSKILLCGGDSNLPGFPEYLAYELKLSAEIGNAWVNIVSFEKHIPEIELKESLSYAIALGLALRSL